MPFDPNVLEIGSLYTRPELAPMWGYASHEAISKGVVTPAGSHYIILFVTREKQRSSTQYRDFVSGDYLHWEGEKKHGNDRRIARAYERGEELHLFYRDVHHTPFRYYGQVLPIRFIPQTTKPSEFVFRLVHDLSAQDDLSRRADELEVLAPTERDAVVKARVGQGDFRENLLRLWTGCAVTDVRLPDLLRASHIKPWRWCSNSERLDPFNGLLLLPHYDHLFDRGYIAFDDTGSILVSPALRKLPPARAGIDAKARLRRIETEHLPFLEFHYREVFLKRVASD